MEAIGDAAAKGGIGKELPDVDGALRFNPLHHAGVKTGARSERFVIWRAQCAEHGGLAAHGGHFLAAFLAFGQMARLPDQFPLAFDSASTSSR